MTLDNIWMAYAAAGIPTMASQNQVNAMKNAFYAGAAGMMGAIDSVSNENWTKEMMITQYEIWRREIATALGVEVPRPELAQPAIILPH